VFGFLFEAEVEVEGIVSGADLTYKFGLSVSGRSWLLSSTNIACVKLLCTLDIVSRLVSGGTVVEVVLGDLLDAPINIRDAPSNILRDFLGLLRASMPNLLLVDYRCYQVDRNEFVGTENPSFRRILRCHWLLCFRLTQVFPLSNIHSP